MAVASLLAGNRTRLTGQLRLGPFIKENQMSAIVIRPMQKADLDAIAALWSELGWMKWIGQSAPEQIESIMAQRLAESQADESHVALVAEDGKGEVLGYTAMHYLPYFMMQGPEAYVSELFVSSDARGKGVGKRLLEHLKGLAKERGCCRMMLFTGRDRESYERGFYKKQDWEERPQIANFVHNLMEF
jgi:GNAT superfamily N-acetyltransferase